MSVTARGWHPRESLSPLLLFVVMLLASCDDGREGRQPGPEAEEESTESSRQTALQAVQDEFTSFAQALEDGRNAFFGRAHVREFEAELAGAEVSDTRRVRLHGQLSFEHLRLGDLERAVGHMDSVFSLVESFGQVPTTMMHQLRVMVELRRAEISNCIEQHNRECCIFPLAGGGVHRDQEPARRLQESLLQILAAQPDRAGVQWLLNITGMALGTYPEGIPERFRLPPEALRSEREIPRFLDVAPGLGIDAFNLCGGALAEDFDNDGFLDIFTTTSDPRGHALLYRNTGDGRFEDLSKEAGLQAQLGGLNCVGADYDNDGDIDVLVLRGAWMGEEGRVRNSLLRNEGSSSPGGPVRFTDVTREAGLAEPAYPSQAAVWGDFDLDGDLDLYLGNESPVSSGPLVKGYPSQLFRNNGDGSFSDVAASAGVENFRLAKGVAVGDYDNDGDLDLYVSNIGKNRLYRNDTMRDSGGGRLRFTDVAPELEVTAPEGRSFAPWFFDWNNDGWLDLFVTAYDATTADVMRDYRGLRHDATPPSLYQNVGGRFENVTAAAGLDHAWLPMGASFGDIDHDGFLDIYLATGDPGFETLMPNVMLRNDAGERFQNVTTSGGFGHLQKGHGICFADFDHDGDQDIYHQLGGFYPSDKFHNALFLNPGGGGRHLAVELEGRSANRSGLGARLEVTVETTSGLRVLHRAVGSVSSFGGSPIRRQEIGLGDATRILRLSVTWPGGGEPDIHENLPVDRTVIVTQGEAEVELLRRKAIRFRGVE